MTITEKAESFVSSLLKDRLSSSYTYHNFEHTRTVVNSVEKLSENEQVSTVEITPLLLAAWFHDTGYIFGPDNHEQQSVAIFEDFATQNQLDPDIARQTRELILATRMNHEPGSLSEAIIRDADCAHFGNEKFQQISEKLRLEWQLTQNKKFSQREWDKGNLDVLTKWHKFHTRFACCEWQPKKEVNVAQLKQKLQHMDPIVPEKEKGRKKKPDRGIETLFRTTLNNHTQLSQIADSKANILLSVNAIIISIALSTLIPKLDSPGNAHLITPTFILLLFSVVSIIFAILSTRPKINSSEFSLKEVQDRKINLLFFGNFQAMPLEEYQAAMREMMNDRDYLYDSLIRDLYLLGKVLHRKYKLLRITYTVFMIGIICSVISFVLAFKMM